MNKIIVIGGGVSGIATAHYLRQNGFTPILIERNPRLGGRIGITQLGDKTVELGGKNIGRRYRLFREFASRYQHNDYEFFGINSSRVENGKIRTIDSTRKINSIKNIIAKHSFSDLLRFAKFYFLVSRKDDNGFLGADAFTHLSQRHKHASLSDVFAHDFCDHIVRPMVVRMNGAEPEETYIGNFGSNIRMIMDSYDQLHDGMHALLDDFAHNFDIRLNTEVMNILFDDGHVCGVVTRTAEGEVEELFAEAVVITTPANHAADILEPSSLELADTLRTVKYYPVNVTIAEYNRDIFNEAVRAIVFPKDSPLSNAGAYGIRDLNIVRYTFSGETARSLLMADPGDEELAALAETQLNRYIPVSDAERTDYISHTFKTGLCAYTRDYDSFRTALDDSLNTVPGLYLTGDYLRGASIEACFRTALETVTKIAS